MPQSWRDQFDQSLARFLATGGGCREGMSLDALIEEMPLEAGYLVTRDMDDLRRAAMLAMVRRLIPFISSDLENGPRLCESPPELAMLHAIALVAWEWTDGVLVRDQFGAGGLIATRGVFLEVQPQARIGNYRPEAPVAGPVAPRLLFRPLMEVVAVALHDHLAEDTVLPRSRSAIVSRKSTRSTCRSSATPAPTVARRVRSCLSSRRGVSPPDATVPAADRLRLTAQRPASRRSAAWRLASGSRVDASATHPRIGRWRRWGVSIRFAALR